MEKINSKANYLHKHKRFGKWKMINYEGNNKYRCECNVCGSDKLFTSQQVKQERDTKCRVCSPVKQSSIKQREINQNHNPYAFNLTFTEIAEQLHLHKDTVRKTYKSAMEKIQKSLSEEQSEILRTLLNDLEAEVMDFRFMEQ